MTINWKKDNDVTICWYDVIDKFFWRNHVFPVKFSHWSKFHTNIMTRPGVMTIFVYKGLTRNPEIGNTVIWVCPISGDWDKLGIPNLALIFLIKCYWILRNARVTANTVTENQQRVKLPPPKLVLKCSVKSSLLSMMTPKSYLETLFLIVIFLHFKMAKVLGVPRVIKWHLSEFSTRKLLKNHFSKIKKSFWSFLVTPSKILPNANKVFG